MISISESPDTIEVRPGFVDGCLGKLFVVSFRPTGALCSDRAVICLPPFAEEMNKCRRMLALQGQLLAKHGITYVLPDVFGTGDSDGDFAEASWDTWRKDIDSVARWLITQGVKTIDILGVRAGIHLSGGLLKKTMYGTERIVVWNPISQGQKMVDQLFRTRKFRTEGVDAGMSVSQSREALAQAGGSEIAGYWISQALLDETDQLDLRQCSMKHGQNVYWVDVSIAAAPRISRQTQKQIEVWEAEGASVEYERIVGRQFWLGPEIELVPTVLSQTTSFFLKQ